MIPVYMSHRIYVKKREESEATDRALKFWTINSFLFITDFLECFFLDMAMQNDSYICYLYFIIKAGVFVTLFLNNFHYSAVLYDWIVPNVLPPIQPYVELIISKAQVVVGFIFTRITPALAQSLAGQMKNLALYLGGRLVSMLEFRAAVTEPQPVHKPEPGRAAVSFIAEEGEDLLGERGNANVTQMNIRSTESPPNPARQVPIHTTPSTNI